MCFIARQNDMSKFWRVAIVTQFVSATDGIESSILKSRSIFLIFPQTFLIFFLILALRVGDSPTWKGPGYTSHCYVVKRGSNIRMVEFCLKVCQIIHFGSRIPKM